MTNKFPITRSGFDKMEHELKHLKFVERAKVVESIADARAFGDLSENAEYHAAKEKQRMLESRIFDLEDKLYRAEIIDVARLSGDVVKFGATVTILDDATEENTVYTIVGEYEADITKKMISIVSPLAKALIGKKTGDIVEVSTPKGLRAYEIVSVVYHEVVL